MLRQRTTRLTLHTALPYWMIILALTLILPHAQSQETSQDKSPAQVAWEQQVGPKALKEPAFQFVAEDPALPRVLLIGDSISIGYTPAVRALLRGKANVLRIPVNGGPSSQGIESLAEWLGNGKWDVIHANWGLHDIKRMRDGQRDITAAWQVSADQYEKNLDRLMQQLKATGATVFWAATTPVPEGAGGRIKGDEVLANAIAARVMTRHAIPINDLYAWVLPHLAKYQRPQNVHFTPEGSAFLAQRVAERIAQALQTRAAPASTKPPS